MTSWRGLDRSVAWNISAYTMALTSFFDKSETGAGVIMLILIFGGLPAMFLAVRPHRLHHA